MDAGGVAGDDDRVRLPGGQRAGGPEDDLGEALRGERAVGHVLRIHRQHQVRVGCSGEDGVGEAHQTQAGIEEADAQVVARAGGGVGAVGADGEPFGAELDIDALGRELVQHLEHVLVVSAESIDGRNDEGVALADVGDAVAQHRPVGARTTLGLLEDAVALPHGLELSAEVLADARDAHVGDALCGAAHRCDL